MSTKKEIVSSEKSVKEHRSQETVFYSTIRSTQVQTTTKSVAVSTTQLQTTTSSIRGRTTQLQTTTSSIRGRTTQLQTTTSSITETTTPLKNKTSFVTNKTPITPTPTIVQNILSHSITTTTSTPEQTVIAPTSSKPKTSSVKIINVTELKSSNSSLKTRMSNIENRCNCTTDLRWTRNCKIVDKNNCLECEVETCMIIEMQEDTYCSILKCVSLLTTTTFKPITHSPVPPAHHEDMTKYIILGILLFICIVVSCFAAYKFYKKRITQVNEVEMQVIFNASDASINFHN